MTPQDLLTASFTNGANPPPVQTLGETPPGAHQFVRIGIEWQRRGAEHMHVCYPVQTFGETPPGAMNSRGRRPGVPSTIE